MKSAVAVAFLLGTNTFVGAFTSKLVTHESRLASKNHAFATSLAMSPPVDTTAEKGSFIDTELRAAAIAPLPGFRARANHGGLVRLTS